MSAKLTPAQRWLRDIERASMLIKPDLLAREKELAQSKWFAYRFMSPLAATMLFGQRYSEGYQQYVRRHIDARLAQRVTGQSLVIPARPTSSFTQLWQARQRADELGMPYELIIGFGFQFAGDRQRNQPPRPIQLFANERTDRAWKSEFEKYAEQHLPLHLQTIAEVDQYRIEHWRKLPAQAEFREFLAEYLRSSTKSWSTAIGTYCLKLRQLPFRRGLKLAPQHMRHGLVQTLKRDRAIYGFNPRQAADLPGIAFATPCLGLKECVDASSAACQRCPHLAVCLKAADAVSDKLVVAHGTVSPVEDLRRATTREKTKERVRRCRARKKELSTLTSSTDSA